ncbi:uncharacterized protein LOC121872960 [Homarus americanus]|uniref:Putative elevenin-like n=1 Tax=Homarus americanus TaxID=6706 RepID=A0A8J5JXL8_HOMAM|nr:uncharacterized protein LOC121872960 [Homarus americanus]KAG7163379.1 putative elevenin-like [Homarus americanus]
MAASAFLSVRLTTVVLLTTLACLQAYTNAVDCRKFVFAPVCRGIIAKRMVSEKRSSFRPTADTQWNSQYRAPTETEAENLLLASSYDDVMEPRPQEDMVVVRAGSDVVQVPAYVFGVIERSLQGERK